MKILNVNIRRWFDKVNGNSYFACQSTLIEENKKDIVTTLQFQYGYGSHPEFKLARELKASGVLKGKSIALWSLCEKNKIRLIINDQNCKKRECIFSE